MQGLWATLRREPNCTSLLLSLGIVACISTLTWCHTSQVGEVVTDFTVHRTETCGEVIRMAAVLCLLVLSMWYITDCCLYKAYGNLHLPRANAEEVMACVQNWRRAVPRVWWRAVTYHYQECRQRSSRNRSGKPNCANQVYEVRVNNSDVTHSYCYGQHGVADISKDLQLSPRGPVTFIRFSKGFTFTNSVVKADYEEQRRRFFADNKPLGQFLEMHEGMEVGRFYDEEMMLACGDRLWWLHTLPTYWVMSALLLSWPLRILCLSRTAYVDYKVIKIFGIDYVERPTTSGNSNGVGQEDGTRDGVYVVPSYPGAMLHTGTRFFTRNVVRRNPMDRFQGRTVTSPTEDPDDYGEVLQLPELPRPQRSPTDRSSSSSATLVAPPRVTRTLLDMETSV